MSGLINSQRMVVGKLKSWLHLLLGSVSPRSGSIDGSRLWLRMQKSPSFIQIELSSSSSWLLSPVTCILLCDCAMLLRHPPKVPIFSPRQPWFYGWGFNLPRGQALLEKWNLIPEGVDILITHGPPLGKVWGLWFAWAGGFIGRGVWCLGLYARSPGLVCWV